MGERSDGLRSQAGAMYVGRLQHQRKPMRVFWVLLAAVLALALILAVIATQSKETFHLNWQQQAKQDWQIRTMIVCEQGLIWVEEL